MDRLTVSRKLQYLNLDHFSADKSTGAFDFPRLEPEHILPDELIGFNFAKKTKNENAGVHFFLDDYHFERVWKFPERYLATLRKFKCILTPDFSLFTDMPNALKIYNTYRNRLVGQYYQAEGLRVIPTVSWAEPSSFQYCFDGLPTHSTVAVTALGALGEPGALFPWRQGMEAMLERLEPETILFYGSLPAVDLDYGSTQIFTFPNKNIERLETV